MSAALEFVWGKSVPNPVHLRSSLLELTPKGRAVTMTHVQSRVEERRVQVDNAPARVFIGGEGPALLLVHGGWAGAAMHWSRVWERLASGFQVIAPELPGLGDLERPGLPSIPHYVGWLERLLDALHVSRAWCVGNSFGASVAWSFAGRNPERCLGVVLVNGIPMPKTPAPLLWTGLRPLGRLLMRAALRRGSFTPKALPRAFADPGMVPAELPASLAQEPHPTLETFVNCVIAGDGPPVPRVAPLLVWGENDQLPGTRLRTARKLEATLPGARLVTISSAGHFPQIERPASFVEALESFIGSNGG